MHYVIQVLVSVVLFTIFWLLLRWAYDSEGTDKKGSDQ